MRAIFFDLDGVLANFVAGALKIHGKTLPIADVRWGFPEQVGFRGVDDPTFWAPFGFGFWSNLDPYEDGFALLRNAETLVGAENIGLLTSACDTPGCIDGKTAWVAKHLPEYRRRLFTGSAKDLFAGPRKLLVDDYDNNIAAFRKAGGIAQPIPRPWNKWRDTASADGSFDVAAETASLKALLPY